MSTTARLTLEEYDQMIARGDFETGNRHPLELIDGELRDMSPTGARHEVLVDRLVEWSFRSLKPGWAWVRVQNSIGIPELDSAPQPDLAWVARKSFVAERPLPVDVLLIVEVAETRLDFDRGAKAALYASSGIADYWVVNIPEQAVEIHRQPEEGQYASVQRFISGDQVCSLAFPDATLVIADLFAGLPA